MVLVACGTIPEPHGWPSDCAAVVPVFNHAATIGQVVAGLHSAGARAIIVVDDGSTDGSAEAAEAAGCTYLLRLPCNQGKGAALRQGLKWAAELGCARATTVDADMQHPPREAARLAQQGSAARDALWLGVRNMPGAPAASRIGRWWTNLGTWMCCGCWPHDNQTGLRVYPLPAMNRLVIRSGRYAYEVESLIRAVWSGIPVRRLTVAVDYPSDRISHFRQVRDTLRALATFARLVVIRPLSVRLQPLSL